MKTLREREAELLNAYRMLRSALPLARRTLLQGGVSLWDQEEFWTAYNALFEDVDPSKEAEYGCRGFNQAIDELEDAKKAVTGQ